MSELRSDEVLILNTYVPEDELTVASFDWRSGGVAEETYTIPLTDAVSLKLDQHIHVRPASVTVLDSGVEQSAEQLSSLFGEEFSEQLLSTRHAIGGFAVLHYSLAAENRFAIAKRQLEDHLRQPCCARPVPP